MEEILDIFNDKLEIIGQDTRKNVHRKGFASSSCTLLGY